MELSSKASAILFFAEHTYMCVCCVCVWACVSPCDSL